MSEWRNANTKYKCVIQTQHESKNTYTQQQPNITHNYEMSIKLHTYEMHTNTIVEFYYWTLFDKKRVRTVCISAVYSGSTRH